MDSKPDVRRHDDIKRIHREIEDFQGELLNPTALQGLGINTRKIELDNRGYLQFNPCYFQAREPHILRDYPIDTIRSRSRAFPRLEYRPDTTWEIMEWYRQVLGFETSEKMAAQIIQSQRDRVPDPDDWFSRNGQTHSHIWGQADALRTGPTGTICLQYGMTLGNSLRHKSRDLELRLEEEGEGEESYTKWCIDLAIHDKKGKLPHIILAVVTEARGDDNNLTRCELKAIFRVMRLRTRSHVTKWKDHSAHPVLLMSYVGRKQGRIIHAHHDGESMTIQYSPLMSFENEETAPVELFVRYTISEPTEPQSNTLCIRSSTRI